jgi:eukaryotic-like serine/threonine-protein kinase
VPWYAMELVEGTSLRDHRPVRRWHQSLASGEPNQSALRAVLATMRDVCLALAHLHSALVVHRDLKPENMVIRPSGTPVLVDFGLTAALTEGTEPGDKEREQGLEGTAPYMSPEQIQSEPVDSRADLYSLGCVLFELLTGSPPFSADSPLEVMALHLNAPPQWPENASRAIPAPLRELVDRLLAKTPDARPRSAAEVARCLEEHAERPYPRTTA